MDLLINLKLVYPEMELYNLFFDKVKGKAQRLLNSFIADGSLGIVEGAYKWPAWTQRWLASDWTGDTNSPPVFPARARRSSV
jgi:hypothetical protein